jgi:hypothetical protein
MYALVTADLIMSYLFQPQQLSMQHINASSLSQNQFESYTVLVLISMHSCRLNHMCLLCTCLSPLSLCLKTQNPCLMYLSTLHTKANTKLVVQPAPLSCSNECWLGLLLVGCLLLM